MCHLLDQFLSASTSTTLISRLLPRQPVLPASTPASWCLFSTPQPTILLKYKSAPITQRLQWLPISFTENKCPNPYCGGQGSDLIWSPFLFGPHFLFCRSFCTRNKGLPVFPSLHQAGSCSWAFAHAFSSGSNTLLPAVCMAESFFPFKS